jgi:hypothetical protein
VNDLGERFGPIRGRFVVIPLPERQARLRLQSQRLKHRHRIDIDRHPHPPIHALPHLPQRSEHRAQRPPLARAEEHPETEAAPEARDRRGGPVPGDVTRPIEPCSSYALPCEYGSVIKHPQNLLAGPYATADAQCRSVDAPLSAHTRSDQLQFRGPRPPAN